MSAPSNGRRARPISRRRWSSFPITCRQGKAQVLNYLAYSWVDQNINIDEAFKMLTRAVELAPRDGMIINSLGWAYYRMGRYDEAVRELEKAVELKAGRSRSSTIISATPIGKSGESSRRSSSGTTPRIRTPSTKTC